MGCDEIVGLLQWKWVCEFDYWLIKELWVFDGNCIVVCFVYEWYDDVGNWFCLYGNENWVFDENGLMVYCYVSINDLLICEVDCFYYWLFGCCLDDYLGLFDFGL